MHLQTHVRTPRLPLQAARLGARQRRLGLVLVRRLHARYVKATAAVLRPEALFLSPAHGCLMLSSPALPALWAAGERQLAPPTAQLARALFHRHEAMEPLRPTRNLSLPAAHMTPRLLGVCLALAVAQPSSSAGGPKREPSVRRALRPGI